MRGVRPILCVAAVAALLPLASASPAPEGGIRIVRLDPRFDALVPRDAVPEKIVDGHTWVEGPVWNRAGGYLLFSEIPSNSIYKWQEGSGTSLYLRPSGYTGAEPFPGPEPGSNGLAFDPDGRLVRTQHGNRRIVRREADGRDTVLADRFEGSAGSGRLNSPNDLVFKSNADLYFTDPPFGLPHWFDDPGKELPFQGVYRLSTDGTLTLLTKDVRAPNGLAFSPNEKTLYVSNADRENAVWLAFEVKDDGLLGESRVFFDATSWTKTGKGAPDGIKVDHHGNLFAAGPGGLHVFAPDGAHLGSFAADGVISNCAWGGDGSVLYFTAGSAVYRVRLTTRGR